ncbi:putative Amino acid transporter [Spironucleus salmonicida]|nr:putative Amino acid transporter [Spironucleus salmonicida]KAH0570954.1 putative Amino acid transporter [Spironucleus salmonicida]
MDEDDTYQELISNHVGNPQSSYQSIYQKFKLTQVSHLSQKKPHRATLFSSTLNLTNTILGAGILTIPFNFNRTGYVFGYIQQGMFAILAYYTFHLLGTSARATKCFNYQLLIQSLLNKTLGYLSSFCILIFTSFIMVSFCILIRDNLFFLSVQWHKALVFAAILVLAITPLSSVPELNMLQYSSLLSIFCGFYVVLFTVSLCVLKSTNKLTLPEMEPPIAIKPITFQFFASFAYSALAFAGHFNALNVFQEVKNHSSKSFNKSAFFSIVCILIMNLLISTGYFVFSDQVEPNILQNFDNLIQYRALSYICNISLVIILVCSYPLMMFCFKANLLELCCRKREIKYKHQVIIVIFLNILFGGISLFLTDVGIVLDVVSSIACVPLVIVFPGLLGLRWSYEEHDRKKKIIGLIVNTIVVIVGVLLMILGVIGCFIK